MNSLRIRNPCHALIPDRLSAHIVTAAMIGRMTLSEDRIMRRGNHDGRQSKIYFSSAD
jgi:polyphosphate kinase